MFTDWSKQVNEQQFKQQNRKCLMLLDNASSHQARWKLRGLRQIAARMMGRDNENRDDESDGEADPNNVEPRTVLLEEAKWSALSLAQFVGDNIALFTEADYRALLLLAEKVQAIH